MAISYYAEITRSKPAAKNKVKDKVGYNVRVFEKNDDVIRQLGGKPFLSGGRYAKVSTYSVKDLSYGDTIYSEESGNYGTGARFYTDVIPATSGTYTPGFYIEIWDPGIFSGTLIGTSVKAALAEDSSLIPVTVKAPAGTTVKIPTIQVTKASVTPDMPNDLKGRNNDTNQSGIDPKCAGFQYDSCNKRWITIWKILRYVNPKTHKVATATEQTQIINGSGPKGYNKQFSYYIEAVTQAAYDENPGKTLEWLRTNKKGVSRPYTAPGWDWASNNMPYDPPGTGPSMGSFKGATEQKFKSFLNKVCGDVPPVDPGTGPAVVEPSTVIPTAGNNSNPPPHIVTRHFSPIADYPRES